MRETFGLSIFGFDIIVDEATAETVVIDVNYFPSFKDLSDFPQVCGSTASQPASQPPAGSFLRVFGLAGRVSEMG